MLKTKRLTGYLAVAAIAAIAAMPATALAQSVTSDPTDGQYGADLPTKAAGATGGGGSGGGNVGGSVAEQPSEGLNASVGSLPFTGMDLIIIVGVALVLMGTGFALRRLSEPRVPRA